MSYPADPLDVVVEIAPGANPATDPVEYSWVDISDRWRVGSEIAISRGKSSPLSDTVPSQCSLTLDNSDGRFVPRNPIGAYYPDLQRNTPIRVRLRHAYDEFGRTVDAWGSALNANPYFETNAANWTGTDGSIARSTAQAHEGVASLLLTPSGAGATPRAESNRVTVTLGVQYRASAWVWCAVARTVDVGIFWFTSGGVFVSTSSTSVAVAASTWTLISGTFTPPGTAGLGSVMARMTGTPPSGHLLYIDEATIEAEAGGWGTADSGQAWTTSGGSASDFTVADGVGSQSLGTVNVFRHSLIDTGLTDQRITVDVVCPVVPTGAAITVWVAARAADTSNYYCAKLTFSLLGNMFLDLAYRQGGTLSSALDSDTSSLGTHTAGTRWRVVLDVAGSRIRATAWRPDVEFDPGWLVEATDTTLTAGTNAGVLARSETGNLNGTQAVTWDSFDVSSTRFTGWVDRWPARWDMSGANKWVPVTAHGVLYRIATAGDATRSALYRYLMAQSWARTAYWPLEDGDSATEGASADDQAAPMTASAPVRFGQAAPTSSGVARMVDTRGAYLHARTPEYYALTWRLEVVLSHSQVPTSTVRSLSWLCPGTANRWDLNSTSTGFQLQVLTAISGGTTVITINSGVIPQPGQLHHIRVDVSHTGATDATAVLYVDGTAYGPGTATGYHAHVPSVVRINPDAVDSDNVPLAGHLIMWGEQPVGSESDQAALGYPGEEAHARVEAVCAEREVPYAPVYGGTVTSDAMGPRPSGSLVGLLREAEATDAGILYELTSGHLSYRRRADLYGQSAAVALDYDAGHVADPFEPSEDDAQLRNDVTARRPSGSEARVTDDDHITQVGRYETSLAVNPEDDARLEQLAAWAVHRGTVPELRFDTIAMHMSRAGATVIGQWLSCDIGDRVTVENVPTHLTPDDVDVILAGYTETIQYPRGWAVEMVCEPYSPWTVGELDDTTLGRLDTAGSELATGNTSVEVRIDAADRAILTTAEAALFSVGNRVVLHDSDGRRKEATVFTVSSISAPAFGFQDVYLSPAPAETIAGALSGGMDTIRRVDETSLSVATITGPTWTTSGGHVPFDLNIGGERVTATAVASALSDTFTRTVAAGGWGTADTGQAWTVDGTAAQYSVSAGVGVHTVNARNTTFRSRVTSPSVGYVDLQATALLNIAPLGDYVRHEAIVRLVDTSNYYALRVHVLTTGLIDLQLIRVSSGVESVLTSGAAGVTHTAGISLKLRVQAEGSTLRGRVWRDDAVEPGAWQITTTDSTHATGAVGVATLLPTSNTNVLPYTVIYDNVTVLNPQTFTVTRGVNGVEKHHAAGTDVRLYQPLILGL